MTNPQPLHGSPLSTRSTNLSRRGAPASSPGGGLRPASRGSAKPAPMTPRQRETRTSDHQGCSRWKPPTGTAAHRAAKPHIAKQGKARGRHGNADLWAVLPVGPGTARQRRADVTNPQPLHGSPLSTRSTNPHGVERRPVLPVGASDRHRAAARNPHRRRRANVRFALPIIRVAPGGSLRPAHWPKASDSAQCPSP